MRSTVATTLNRAARALGLDLARIKERRMAQATAMSRLARLWGVVFCIGMNMFA